MLQFPRIPHTSIYQVQLQKIEVLTAVLQHLPLGRQAQLRVFHKQLLKSSLFSARIEGNQLTLSQVQDIPLTPQSQGKREISNVMKALRRIATYSSVLTRDLIIELHSVITDKLLPQPGSFRKESSAIYDQFGNMVYLTPSPDEMNQMLSTLLENSAIQSSLVWQEQLLLVAACHYYFEKIHPFVDGNGRTGRVIMHYQLYKTNLFGNTILPLDQFFDEHKTEYYDYLERNTRNIDDFIHYFLDAVISSLEMFLADVRTSLTDPEIPGQNALLPRRQEIFEIIKDHPFVSLDTIARRFPTIPKRTISYDINQLIKQTLVTKHGQTRGVVYTAS